MPFDLSHFVALSESSRSRLLGRRILRAIAFAAGTVALLIVAAWLAVPPIVRAQLESRLTTALHRPVTVESAAFNPFGAELTLRKLAVADRDGATPIFMFDELVANVSSASLWHRAPVFDQLRVVRPAFALARTKDGRYNVQDLIDDLLSGPSDPPRLSLNNIEIVDGSIAFDDGVTGRKHALAGVDVGIPFLSTLPYETSIHVTPRVAGTFNRSRFVLSGSTEPFAERREATLDIDVDGLALPPYVVYAPERPPIDLAEGLLTAHLRLVFVEGKADERRLELRGDARVDRLALKRRDGSLIAGAERVAVALDRLDALKSDVRVASLTIDAPTLDLRRAASGELEWAALAGIAPANRPPAAAPARAPGWNVAVATLAVKRGTIALADATSGFQSTLVDVDVDATNLTTRSGDKAHVKLTFVSSDRIASFAGEADVEPTMPAASGRFELAKFSLGLLFPYYKSALAVDVQKGSLDYASAFALAADGNLRLTDGEATIADAQLALPGRRDPLWRVPQLAAHGIDVDLAARSLGIAQLDSRGTALRVVRERDGKLEMSRLLPPVPAGSAGDSGAWAVIARKVLLEGVAIDVEDRVPKPPVKLAVRDLTLTASDVGNARGAKSKVTLRARVGERGRIAFAGPVTRDPFTLEGDLDASRLSLTAVKAYFEPRVNVVLTSATVAAKGRLRVEVPPDRAPRATWKGNVAVTDLAALDRPTASDLARWKSFRIEGLDVATEPFRASAERIALEDFYARLIVYRDGTLNVLRLLTPGASPEPESGPASTTEAAPEPTPTAAVADAATATLPAPAAPRDALPIAIKEIAFTHGSVNFSDFFIQPNYSTNLTDVTGTVSAMSSERAGDVAIAAKVDGIAPVDVEGRIQPFAKEVALDLTGKARGIDLPPLTPYSGKYAGYGIEKGKLSFDVHYRIEQRKLTAENRIVLDQLTFGAHVDSPSATKLPVLLAVALLKDRNGVIDIKLPISGSIDDPKFSVGGLIIRMILNLIGKAATAPFALLAAAFGGGGEELSTLPFAAGSAAIAPEAQQRIDAVGKALADRPGLKLEIGGRADPAADREALRRAAIDDAMRREKMKSLAASGNAPASLGEVTIVAEERPRWLAAAYRAAPIQERPRNVFGFLKDVPPAEMEAMLYAHAKADDDALRQLANARAIAVKDSIAAHGVADDRLFLLAPKLGDEAGGVKKAAQAADIAATPARVDLALR